MQNKISVSGAAGANAKVGVGVVVKDTDNGDISKWPLAVVGHEAGRFSMVAFVRTFMWWCADEIVEAEALVMYADTTVPVWLGLDAQRGQVVLFDFTPHRDNLSVTVLTRVYESSGHSGDL